MWCHFRDDDDDKEEQGDWRAHGTADVERVRVPAALWPAWPGLTNSTAAANVCSFPTRPPAPVQSRPPNESILSWPRPRPGAALLLRPDSASLHRASAPLLPTRYHGGLLALFPAWRQWSPSLIMNTCSLSILTTPSLTASLPRLFHLVVSS